MFKKATIFAVVLTLVMSSLVFGQFNITKPDAAGGNFVATNQDRASMDVSGAGTRATGVGAGPGVDFFLRYNINPKTYLTAGTGYYTITDKLFQMDFFRSTLLPYFEVKVGYTVNPNAKFSPVFFGGLSAFGFKNKYNLGGSTFTTDMYFDAAPLVGAGVDLAINENTTFHLTGDVRSIVTSSADEKPVLWVAKAGLSWKLNPQSGSGIYQEEIEYPLGDNELASLDDLFMDDSGSSGSGDDEADALALLFAAEESGADFEDSSISPTEFSGASDENLFMQDTEDLRDQVEVKQDALRQLENRVTATEQALASLNSKIATKQITSSSSSYSGSATPVSSGKFQQDYKTALNAFYAKKYTEAIGQFENLLRSNPDHRLASNCQYWIGEAYNQMKKYPDALNSFNQVLQYSSSYKLDDALIMSGIVYMRMGDKQTAKQQFQQLVSRFPKSEYAPKAMRYLGSL